MVLPKYRILLTKGNYYRNPQLNAHAQIYILNPESSQIEIEI